MRILVVLISATFLLSCDSTIDRSNGVGDFTLDGNSYSLNQAHIVQTFHGGGVTYGICFSNQGACVDYGLFQKGTQEHLFFEFGEEWTSDTVPVGTIVNRDTSNFVNPYLTGISGAFSTSPYGESSGEGFSEFSVPFEYFAPDFSSPSYTAVISIDKSNDLYDIDFSVGPFPDGSTLSGSYVGAIDKSPPTPAGLALD